MQKKVFVFAMAAVTLCSALTAYNIQAAESSANEVYVTTAQELLDALADAQAGDEIVLAEGTYVNDEWLGEWAAFYSHSEGTADNPIILRSENPENPAVLSGVSQEDKIALYITGDYWIIKDIALTGAQKGITLDNSNYSVISGCEVYNTGQEGIHLRDNSSYCLIEECYIHDNGTVTPGYGEGIYIGSARGTEGYGFDCHYNTVRGCSIGPNTAAEHIDIKELTIGTVVENCVFDAAGMTGENYADSFVDIKGNDVVVRNNVGYQNGNEIFKDAFQLYTYDNIWGQNAQIYGNTVHLDGTSGNVVSGEDCIAKISNNTRVPDGNIFTGSLITDIMTGDVNEDNSLDTADIKQLNDYLLVKSDSSVSLIGSDQIPDGTIDVFDLCALRQKLNTDSYLQWGFEETGTAGQWSVFNGAGGKTLTLTFGGIEGYRATIAYGYWDPFAVDPETGNTGAWINDDTTSFGTNYFDENGEAEITFDVPQYAVNVKVFVYYYAYYDDELGENIVHDKGEVVLKSITAEY